MRWSLVGLIVAVAALCCGVAGAQQAWHSADYSEDDRGRIALAELLRLVQLYNAGAYACGIEESEDGFAPGLPVCTDAYHDSDYAPPDGRISLTELLRLIQIFSAAGYATDCFSEDGFLPGTGIVFDCDAEGEGEGAVEGTLEGEGAAEGTSDGEGTNEGEGSVEGDGEGEGISEGMVQEGEGEGSPEGVTEGSVEGSTEGELEGEGEGASEGQAEGALEGEGEGVAEGTVDGEGQPEGAIEGEGEPEGSVESEGESEGVVDGEGEPEGTIDGEGEPEGLLEGEGEPEGVVEGEGEPEGVVEGEGEPEGERVPPPYAIGSRSFTFTDASRSNRSIPVQVYYPAQFAAGNAPAVLDATEPFPVIVFGHGFTIGVGNYGFVHQALVPQGFVIALVDTETGFAPNHGNFGQDIAFVADAMLALNSEPGSPFEGLLAPQAGAAGHSMGGGAALLSVQYSANIAAVMPFAPADTNPSAITASASITIPASIISGSGDCVAPPAQHQIPMYQALPGPDRYYVSVLDGSHCQFAQGSFTCNAGQIICLGRTYISESLQHQISTGLMSAWFDATLRGRPGGFAAYDALLTQLDSDGSIDFQTD